MGTFTDLKEEAQSMNNPVLVEDENWSDMKDRADEADRLEKENETLQDDKETLLSDKLADLSEVMGQDPEVIGERNSAEEIQDLHERLVDTEGGPADVDLPHGLEAADMTEELAQSLFNAGEISEETAEALSDYDLDVDTSGEANPSGGAGNGGGPGSDRHSPDKRLDMAETASRLDDKRDIASSDENLADHMEEKYDVMMADYDNGAAYREAVNDKRQEMATDF